MSEQTPARILVIEDEPDISALVAYQLAHAGFQVRTASTGREALRALDSETPDLVVLDLMLPEVSGTEILRTMRSQKATRDTPVIVLTARSDEEDRLRGFELGADDYISKPFSPKELVLRVRAVLRRAPPSEPGAKGGRVLRAGSITVDVGANRVTVAGDEVELTPKEFKMLQLFLGKAGCVLACDEIRDAVWGYSYFITLRDIDNSVNVLRNKFEIDPNNPQFIRTVEGSGYIFETPESNGDNTDS